MYLQIPNPDLRAQMQLLMPDWIYNLLHICCRLWVVTGSSSISACPCPVSNYSNSLLLCTKWPWKLNTHISSKQPLENDLKCHFRTVFLCTHWGLLAAAHWGPQGSKCLYKSPSVELLLYVSFFKGTPLTIHVSQCNVEHYRPLV